MAGKQLFRYLLPTNKVIDLQPNYQHTITNRLESRNLKSYTSCYINTTTNIFIRTSASENFVLSECLAPMIRLRPWRYINLFTYLLTYLLTYFLHVSISNADDTVKNLVEESCTSRLAQETCMSVISRTSFLHQIQHSFIAYKKLART